MEQIQHVSRKESEQIGQADEIMQSGYETRANQAGEARYESQARQTNQLTLARFGRLKKQASRTTKPHWIVRKISAAVITMILLMHWASIDSAAQSTPIVSGEPGNQTVIIYQSGPALIKDRRELDLRRGSNPFLLYGFPSMLHQSSVLPVLDGNVASLRFDNSRSGYTKVLEDLVGKQIRLDHIHGGALQGTLTEFRPGLVVVAQSDGSQVILPGLDGYRVTASDVPLSSRRYPELAITFEPSRAGKQPVDIYYLTPGISWEANYALILNEDETRASLSGWSVIQNRTDLDFENVQVHLVAGELNTGRGAGQMRQDVMMRAAEVADESVVSFAIPEAEALSEFQRFVLPGRHVLRTNEMQRLPLAEAQGVAVRKRFRYASSDRRAEGAESGQISVVFEVENDKEGAIGKPLPAGTVRLYKRESGSDLLTFTGQDRIANIPVGGTISVTSGRAFDILSTERIRSQNRISDRVFEQINEVSFQNVRSEEVLIETERRLQANQRITTSTVPVEMVSANTARFKITVKPGETAAFSFTIRTER